MKTLFPLERGFHHVTARPNLISAAELSHIIDIWSKMGYNVGELSIKVVGEATGGVQLCQGKGVQSEKEVSSHKRTPWLKVWGVRCGIY